MTPAYLRPDGTLRALTLWPEWAWAVHNLDKRMENRTWKLPLGEWFALHAGAYVGGRKGLPAAIEGWDGVAAMARLAGWKVTPGHQTFLDLSKGGVKARQAPHGGIESRVFGLFRVTGYVMGAPGGWHVPRQIGNVFEYRPLVEPVPCSGAQGLWRVPGAVVERMAVLP